MTPVNPYELGDIPPETAAHYQQLAEKLASARQHLLAHREAQFAFPAFDPAGLILDSAKEDDRANPYFRLIQRLLEATFVPYAAGHDGDLGLVGIVGPVVVIHKSAGCGTCGGTMTTDLGVQAFVRSYFGNPDLIVIALNDQDVESSLSIEELAGAASGRMR